MEKKNSIIHRITVKKDRGVKIVFGNIENFNKGLITKGLTQ